MSTAPVRREDTSGELLEDYAQHCAALGLSKSAQGDRVTGASAFLARHQDLTIWMDRPLPVRLSDFARSPLAWPLVGFAMLTGRLPGDFELLAAKHAGRSFAAAVTVIYPQDVARAPRSRDQAGVGRTVDPGGPRAQPAAGDRQHRSRSERCD